MTVCPIALAVGCRKCPIFAVCPVKGLIGDYKKEPDVPPKPAPDPAKVTPKRAPARAKAATKRGAKKRK